MDTIQSDHIVGIKCEFVNCMPLLILAVYLPSANHALEEFKECFEYIWALYDALSADGFVILLFILGDKSKKEPNDRGLLLLDFANFFNICPINLLRSCEGLLESYNSHCWRYHSALDYIFLPNCLLNNVDSAETFELDVDNTSDHLPILFHLSFSERIPITLNLVNAVLGLELSKNPLVKLLSRNCNWKVCYSITSWFSWLGLKVNRQGPTSVMRRPESKIPTLVK